MNTLLKMKIENTCLAYSINAMLFIKGRIDKKELDKRNNKLIDECYYKIASMEPKHESEIL